MAFANLEKLSNRERMLVGLGILAILVLFADRIVVREIRVKQRDMSAEINKAKSRIIGAKSILAQSGEIGSQFAAIRGYVPPSGSNVLFEMQREIENLASEVGVNLTDRKDLPPVPMDFFDKFAIRAEMQGDTEKIMKLMQSIESSPHLLRVTRLEIVRSAKEGDKACKGSIFIDKIVPKGSEQAK